MFEFFVILTLTGLIGFAVSMIMASLDKDPLMFWIIAFIVSGFLMMVGVAGGGACLEIEETKEYEIEVECPKNDNQYSYCPYCGKEIHK